MELTNKPVYRLQCFLAFLRSNGFNIGVEETQDIFSAFICHSSPRDEESIEEIALRSKLIIKAICCKGVDQWRQFEEIFSTYWFPADQSVQSLDNPAAIYPRLRNQRLSGLAGSSSQYAQPTQGQTQIDGVGAGKQRTIGKADFRFLGDKSAMRQAEKLAEELGSRLKKKISRQKKYINKPGVLDLRQTLHKSLATMGEPIYLRFWTKKPKPLKLLVFHDVSHSMTWNNPLLFRFVRGLMKTVTDAHVFAFHTKLFSVTSIYKSNSLQSMLDQLETTNHAWVGGTCIGSCLLQYCNEHSYSTLKKETVILIISDGFDSDDQSLLQERLNDLKKRSRSILWLNPMLGRKGVTLSAAKLKREFPMVDQFMSANSVDGLRNAITEISKAG